MNWEFRRAAFKKWNFSRRGLSFLACLQGFKEENSEPNGKSSLENRVLRQEISTEAFDELPSKIPHFISHV
jgi:hypothetical protein